MFQGSKTTVKTRLQKSFSTGTLFNDAKQNIFKPNSRTSSPANQKKIQLPRYNWLKKRSFEETSVFSDENSKESCQIFQSKNWPTS